MYHLLSQIQPITGITDLLSFVTQPYTNLLGSQLFSGLLILILYAPIYIKTRSVGFMAVLSIVSLVAVSPALPAQGTNFAFIILTVSLGYLLYGAYTSVRR